MKIKELVGVHKLQGIETGTRPATFVWSGATDCNYIKFRLDGVTYIAIENPDDGYRTFIEEIQVVDEDCEIKLPNIDVRCTMRPDTSIEKMDVLEFWDFKTKLCVLAVGTQNIDDYYPLAVMEYYPENMGCNMGKNN